MSDNGFSDDEDFTAKAKNTDSEAESPRHTVEEQGVVDDDDDLFGDGGEDGDEATPAFRNLEDEDLDSGDDEGRTDRVQREDEHKDEQLENLEVMDAELERHAVPEPSDGELYLFKVPHNLSIEPKQFSAKTFQPPTTDHHSRGPPSETFSAYNAAMTTIRWRHSPSDHGKLQSNARILRWSDGSLTLQFASDPETQYEMDPRMLAPPQHNPKIRTPTSIHYRPGHQPKISDRKDTHTYLAAPHEGPGLVRITNKFTTNLSLVAGADSKDAALVQLQNALAAAAQRGRSEAEPALSIIDIKEDPELDRARMEAAHKEKLKQARAREKAAERERDRASRAFGRTGVRSSGYGLTLGGLEDEDSGRRGAKKAKPKTGLRRDWSDEEDYRGSRFNREDEYDEEDDFIAASDEEPEVVEDDDDDDDGIIEAPRARRAKGTASPKRGRGGDDEDEEEVVTNVRSVKRRRVVDDDEDDE